MFSPQPILPQAVKPAPRLLHSVVGQTFLSAMSISYRLPEMPECSFPGHYTGRLESLPHGFPTATTSKIQPLNHQISNLKPQTTPPHPPSLITPSLRPPLTPTGQPLAHRPYPNTLEIPRFQPGHTRFRPQTVDKCLALVMLGEDVANHFSSCSPRGRSPHRPSHGCSSTGVPVLSASATTLTTFQLAAVYLTTESPVFLRFFPLRIVIPLK